jgi:hypothetical protein
VAPCWGSAAAGLCVGSSSDRSSSGVRNASTSDGQRQVVSPAPPIGWECTCHCQLARPPPRGRRRRRRHRTAPRIRSVYRPGRTVYRTSSRRNHRPQPCSHASRQHPMQIQCHQQQWLAGWAAVGLLGLLKRQRIYSLQLSCDGSAGTTRAQQPSRQQGKGEQKHLPSIKKQNSPKILRTCAGQFYFCRNWVTEVSWHATLVAKVRKSV